MEREEFVYLNVFDEKITVESVDDEQRTHSTKHWIGGCAIPLSAILAGGKVEGRDQRTITILKTRQFLFGS